MTRAHTNHAHAKGRRAGAALIAAASVLLAGCLEVEQFPGWRDGVYDGKPDPLAWTVLFHGDRLAWWAAIANRHLPQNEYNRTLHPGGQP